MEPSSLRDDVPGDLGPVLRKSLGNPPDSINWDRVQQRVFADLDKAENKKQPFFAGDLFVEFFGWLTMHPLQSAVAIASVIMVSSSLFIFVHFGFFAPVARLVSISGEVSKSSAWSRDWRPCTRLEKISRGESLQCGEKSSAVALSAPGTGILLSEKSQLTLKIMDRHSHRYLLAYGEVLVKLAKGQGPRDLTVATANALCRALGTVFSVSSDIAISGEPRTTLTVWEGHVSITNTINTELTAVVDAGQSVTFTGSGAQSPVTIEPEQKPIDEKQFLDLLNSASGSVSNSFGFISITSEPSGANIFCDGNPIGITPLLVQKEAGTRKISLTKKDFLSWNTSITLKAQQTQTIFARLDSAVALPEPVSTPFELPPGINPPEVAAPDFNGREKSEPLQGYLPNSTQEKLIPITGALSVDTILQKAAFKLAKKRASLFDTFHVAAKLWRVNFYWEPPADVTFDTIGLSSLLAEYGISSAHDSSAAAGAIALKENGYRLFKVSNISALVVALMCQQGFTMATIGQWSAQTDCDQMITQSALNRERSRVASRILWEVVKKGSFGAPSRTRDELPVTLEFLDGGCGTYDGRALITGTKRQIQCVDGSGFSEKSRACHVSNNIVRHITDVYCIGTPQYSGKKIIERIEQVMDSLKLDLSFQTPVLKIVQ